MNTSFAGTRPVLPFPRARLLFIKHFIDTGLNSGLSDRHWRSHSRVFPRSNASQCACGAGELPARTNKSIFRRPLHRHLHSPEPPARCRPICCALTDLLAAPVQRVLRLVAIARASPGRSARQRCSSRHAVVSAAPVRGAAADQAYATDAAPYRPDNVPARRFQDWTVYKGKSALCIKVRLAHCLFAHVLSRVAEC